MRQQMMYRGEPKKARLTKMDKAYNFDMKTKKKAAEAKKKLAAVNA